jgi:hypothetical protein
MVTTQEVVVITVVTIVNIAVPIMIYFINKNKYK